MSLKFLIAYFFIASNVTLQIEGFLKKEKCVWHIEMYIIARVFISYLIIVLLHRNDYNSDILLIGLFLTNAVLTAALIDPRFISLEQCLYLLCISVACDGRLLNNSIGIAYITIFAIYIIFTIIFNKKLSVKYGNIYLPPNSVIGSKTVVEESKNHKDPENNEGVVI